MKDANRNTLWGATIVDELEKNGVEAVCISPGSRSTPLTVACAMHDSITTYSHLDERSAAYFALGHARRSGTPVPLICTSGTAAANYYPAVIEASQSRVPMIVLSADRPPVIRDSGANQTIDQEKLYGDAVRWYRDLSEPAADARKLRSLRTTVARALTTAEGVPPGPVHLNVPFEKPLEPKSVLGDIPDDLPSEAYDGRETAYVETTSGASTLDPDTITQLGETLSVSRGLLFCGPMNPSEVDPQAVAAFAHASGYPVLADPLSNVRFGGVTRTVPIIGGYDGFVDSKLADWWPDPEAVIRIGASPTSKSLRQYLSAVDSPQYCIDPAGAWREESFTATDLIEADPNRTLGQLARVLQEPTTASWRQRWTSAESHFQQLSDEMTIGIEGRLLRRIVASAPDPSTLYVSNSMPVRDLDRFAQPSQKHLTVLGNRGASGIDGITSSSLGAGAATTESLTVVIGDLALYHDMNGLLAVERCDVDVTVIVINNDGGGIFHKLPISSYDPPFTEQFVTPHAMDFESAADQYHLEYHHVDTPAADTVETVYTETLRDSNSHLIEIDTNSRSSIESRENFKSTVLTTIENGLSLDHSGESASSQ
jgi:2-succinyl-5-enolpyruvyl-6-hydroxy-3-cyclohexene-1-carboxylate synthase